MTRSHLFAGFLALALLVGCDKQGIHPYGTRTDIVQSCGLPASVHLHSSADGTDILIMGTNDPATPVSDPTTHCMMVGSVARDSSTDLMYGGYELDGAGNGVFHLTAHYTFVFEPNVSVAGRGGSDRHDEDPPFPNPFTLTSTGDQTTMTLFGTSRTYTAFDSVVQNVNLADPQGPTDLYEVFNLALFLSQVRIPAFGGLGMTRYIMNKTTFLGLVEGSYSVNVKSLVDPSVTMEYTNLEDFPGVWVNGAQYTSVNISANGSMTGVLAFELRDPANPANVRFAGTVDYTGIQIADGLAVGGNYTLATTLPTVSSTPIPYSIAYNTDLTHILPVTP